ncbi:HAAS signaling domain-containing protein [Actinoplanes sp. NPDC049118]|uniref:HAAS signaling domain-containing protein n=1 Tax=Actinoplanes sp. NPDC049118 TaxID=3155769 RepID=UPI0034109931
MTTTAQDEINLYVFAVRAALGDLPESLRDELLEDLPEHLAEVLADGGGTLTERLGSPEAYAADLRGTAGFVGGFPDPPGRTHQLLELRDQALVRLNSVDARLGPLLGYSRVSEFLVLLRPAWWVLRGYLAAMVLAWMLDDSGQPIGLLPRIGGSEVVALLLLGIGVLGSIWLGRRSLRLSRWPRMSLYAASVILVLVALGGFTSADSSTRDANYTDVNYDNPYSNIEDLFVYDEQGRLITNARIFDQNGEPLRLGNPYCYDDAGNYNEVQTLTYPYCPSRAPYRLPSQADPSRSAAPAESADPADEAPGRTGPGPVPAPPGSSRISPSATPAPGPSAGVAATSAAPR